ncbi:MAG: hypothetical protein ACRC1K_11415, partial [Planctomycetia bacterium]
ACVVRFAPFDPKTAPPEPLTEPSGVDESTVEYVGPRVFRHPTASVELNVLVDRCFEWTGYDALGVVMVAEAAGLVGAALRHSPADFAATTGAPDRATSPLTFPAIRRWLSFTPEPSFGRAVTVVVGVAVANEAAVKRVGLPSKIVDHLRPTGGRRRRLGHFHAAAFAYRHLPRRLTDLSGAVAGLFRSEDLQAVLHLIGDDRPGDGSGDSRFVRGACWIGPLFADPRAAEPPQRRDLTSS